MFKKYLAKRKLKKQLAYEEALALRTGLRFSSEILTDKSHFPLAKYLVNALALFGAVYGSLITVISGFNLDLNADILFLVCVILSIVMSFMYVNEKIKIMLYVFFLALSMFLVGRFFIQINSGVSAFHNVTIEAIDNVMELDQIREYMEFYDNRYISMTFAFCVVALALSILLNIAVSEYMNFWAVFLLTFPVVQYGMFFGFDSNRFGMICVIGSWILIAAVRYTNSYNGLTNKLKSVASVKKHKHEYGFVTDSNNVAKIALVLLVFILSFTGLLMLIVPQAGFELNSPLNKMKTRANDTVNKVLSYGIYSLFPIDMNRTNSGELSNASTIRYDGQIDLKVTMADYGESRTYLRNYVGVNYNPYNFKWGTNNQMTDDILVDDTDYTARALEYDYNNDQIISNTKRVMDIKVVDANIVSKYSMFMPYYTVLDGDYSSKSFGMAFPKNSNLLYDNRYTFYTVDESEDNLDDFYGELFNKTGSFGGEYYDSMKKMYDNLAVYGYCDVPKANIDVIDEFLKKYDIKASDKDVVNKVVKVLADNYNYTLKPGSVPRNEDYVNFFLKSNKKGYCMHFASAATLIYRRLGIPARYVEGYVIDRENFEYSKDEEELSINDYVSGDAYNDDIVQTISLPDSNGHAWVEVYVYGFGWQPVEVTEAASIDSDEGQGIFSRFFGTDSAAAATADDLINQVREMDVNHTSERIKAFVLCLVTLLVLWYLFRMILFRIRLMIKFNQADYKTAIGYRISYLIDLYKYKNFNEVNSYVEFFDKLKENAYILDADKKVLDEGLEKALFDKGKVSEESYYRICNAINKSKKLIISKMSLKNKIKLYLIDFKW
ncbi:MAG: hypothetical protein K5656_04895 [Lachnospiraceae bacterium]|nr:hypothetical protein [Lachnospiraceae bacterium]